MRPLALLLAGTIVLAACDQLEAADDLGTTQLIVRREADSLHLRSRNWTPGETLVILCPTEPVEDTRNLADAGTWRLDETCQVYGRFATQSGVDVRLGLGDLDAGRRPTFDAAPDWWLLLVALRNGETAGVYRTVVSGGPIDPSVTPGPSPTPASSPTAGDRGRLAAASPTARRLAAASPTARRFAAAHGAA